jgi:hypothetical protein
VFPDQLMPGISRGGRAVGDNHKEPIRAPAVGWMPVWAHLTYLAWVWPCLSRTSTLLQRYGEVPAYPMKRL